MNKVTFLILVMLFCLAAPVSGQVVINEILASNTTVNTDEDATYQDWVELYNGSASPVSLNGYGLSDDPALPYKWTFPAVTMAPNAYLLIWCSDKNRTVAGQPLHTNWKISSGGETITLTNGSGTAVSTASPPTMPSNISYGRVPNGTGNFLFIQAVTPAAANAAVGYSEILPPPSFSQSSGFYTSGISVALSTTVAGASIIYTTDGSDPSPSNLAGTTYNYRNVYAENPGDTQGPFLQKNFQSMTYSAPISVIDRTPQPNDISMINSTYWHNPTFLPSTFNIFKGTVVRAMVVKPGALPSQIVSRTYIVTPAGSSRFSLPVISIGITESKLFDHADGIYVAGKDFDDWRDANPTADALFENEGNYYRRGIAFEKNANFTYLVNGAEVVNQNIGLRIHGGESSTYESKSFNIYARPEYGADTMDYKFFSDLADNKFDRLVFRNAGGDFHGTMFRDALNQELCKSLRVERESYQPAITLVNGEYWGILNIREKMDDNYFKRVYGIDNTELDLLEDSYTEVEFAEAGDNVNFLAMVNFITNNPLSVDANYQQAITMVDPDNFMDYFIANIFFDNTDWPGTNTTFWRKRTAAYDPTAPYGHDGRWRWAFHDMDDTFGIGPETFNHNNLAVATAPNGPEYPNPPTSTFMLRKLLENTTFKNNFINRFADLMNSSFLSSRIVATLNAMNSVILPEIPEHIARWKSPPTINDRQFYLNFETDFANARPAFQRNHIRTKFAIASNINVTLNVSNAAAGYIKMNTIEIKDGTDGIVGNPYPWTGIYFSGIPVKMKAIANPGFVFDHWEGASTATTAEITISAASAFAVTAVFSPATVATSQPIYFWMMDSAIPNDTPLTSLSTTYKIGATNGSIQYTSCLAGYPFTSANPLWRHASMERRNNPTPINYIAEANANIVYAPGIMKGLQITEPLQSGTAVNTMVFNFGTTGYKDIKFSFAAVNELTNATGILVDYSVAAGSPVWTTIGLAASTLPLTAAYQLFNVDFTSIVAANNNSNFKVRLRFTGTNLQADAGNRITFNNIAVHGTSISLANPVHDFARFTVYPNPVSDIINVSGVDGNAVYNVFSIDGKLVQNGRLDGSAQIDLQLLTRGMYLLQLTSGGRTESKKIIKN